MAPRRTPAPSERGIEFDLRARMVGAGVWLTVVIAVVVSAWVAVTWDRPHRALVVVLVGLTLISAVVVHRVPRDFLVTGGRREPRLLAWSAIDVAVVAVLAALDGGVRSPAVLLLFLTLIYAALSYPRAEVVAVAGFSMLAVALLAFVGPQAAGPGTDAVYLGALLVTLGVAGALCTVQAGIQTSRGRELDRLAREDPLTGVLNRRGLAARLDAALAGARDTGGPLALVLLDFDGFKAINDREGHAAGDALLVWAAREAQRALGTDAVLGRAGGDEFVAVLPDADLAAGEVLARAVGAALAPRIGVSMGVASFPGDGGSATELQHTADLRLYAAKARKAGPALGADPLAPGPPAAAGVLRVPVAASAVG